MRINLLPWRAQAQRRLERVFILQTFMVVVCALITVLMITQWQQHWLHEQQSRHQQLEQGIEQFEHTLARFAQQDEKRRALQSRLGLVNRLQQQRNNVTAVLNFIPTVIPPGAYLTRLVQQEGQISLEGWVTSNAELARLLAALEKQSDVSGLNIDTVITDEKVSGPNKRFKLNFSLTRYVAPQLPGDQEEES
ncbi:PilN domain-containing protein [Salinivibrio sp. ES.052]|uniref:PilN domain-containing protein n=1 Tax=Salinivibrio sp. ES.052 TaxID=1882823 RepID=UPI000928D8C3|nr:PilN domain-containing protein [Salinivibrio sp. ES.052]SIO18179.1 Tfp pilus assembly protein PilN [Salinivibrio sp. ES.052]